MNEAKQAMPDEVRTKGKSSREMGIAQEKRKEIVQQKEQEIASTTAEPMLEEKLPERRPTKPGAFVEED
jgi:hypothetical protein